MAKAKNTYSNIGEELDWLELRAKEIKRFIDDNPYHEVVDRDRVSQRLFDDEGNVVDEKYILVCKREDQQTSLRNSMKEYAQILEIIDKLREKELAKVEARGGGDIPYRMRK